MKAKLFAILFMFALAACIHLDDRSVETRLATPNTSYFIASPENKALQELSAIDSLMWHQPDSALTLLLPWFDTCCRDALNASSDNVLNASPDTTRRNHCVSTTTAYNRHYAHLLLSELLYKNDYPQTNRTELQQAVAYFDSLVGTQGADTRGADTFDVSLQGRPRRDARRASAKNATQTNIFLAARAHYINGVGYYENDSVIQACAEYFKALEIIENRFGEKELMGKMAMFMALTYTRLVDIFSDFYLHEPSIYFAHYSLSYYRKQNTPLWYAARMLNEIGSHFDMMNELDSANYYYGKAIDVLDDKQSIMFRDIAAHQIYLEYKKNYMEAKAAIQQLEELLSKTENSIECMARCASIGEIYYREEQLDSAWNYLNMVYLGTSNIGTKKQVAEWLVEICRVQGRITEMHVFAEFLVPFANQEENQSATKSQLTELYKDFVQNRQDLLHQQEKEKNMKWTAIAVGVFLFVLFMLAFIIITMKRRNTKRMAEQNKKHHIEQAAISSRLKRSNQEIRELKDQIRQQQNMAAPKSEQAATFADEPICRLIMERVNKGQFLSQMDCSIYKDYALDKDQLYALRKAADRHFNQFTTRISKAHPELTRGDLDYCCLYLLGLTDADIAALMQRAYNTVNERNSKLRRIFGSENTISITLETIANESTLI